MHLSERMLGLMLVQSIHRRSGYRASTTIWQPFVFILTFLRDCLFAFFSCTAIGFPGSSDRGKRQSGFWRHGLFKKKVELCPSSSAFQLSQCYEFDSFDLVFWCPHINCCSWHSAANEKIIIKTIIAQQVLSMISTTKTSILYSIPEQCFRWSSPSYNG